MKHRNNFIMGVLTCLLCLGLGATIHAAEVTVPAGYEEGTGAYPVLYLLAEDGKEAFSTEVVDSLKEAIQSPEAMDMILVTVPLEGEGDLFAAVEAVVAEVDASYRTVSAPSARAIAGTGVGGYLAYLLAYSDGNGTMLTAPNLFGMVGAICPDFQSDSPYRESYGDFLELLQAGPLSNMVATAFYSFIQTPSEAENSYEAGGANDCIALFIRMGAAYGGVYDAYYGNADNTVLELTIPHEEDTPAFRASAAKQMAVGFSRKMMSSLATGYVTLSPQAATEDVTDISVGYGLNLSEDFGAFTGETAPEAPLTFTLLDGDEVLSDPASTTAAASTGLTSGEAVATLPNIVPGEQATVRLSANLLGMEWELGTAPLVRIMTAGEAPEEQFVDLMGEWDFFATESVTPGELPDPADASLWEPVLPCLAWWNEGFSTVTNMKAYAGYAWYAKHFTLPEGYPEEDYILTLGAFDETDMVWVNGTLVGCTGLNQDSWEHEADMWDTIRVYEVPADALNIGGENVCLVLTHNQSGDGGWYTGHPCLYTQAAYDAKNASGSLEAENPRFIQVTIDSAYKASAIGSGNETEPENVLIYLPEGYEGSEEAYPTCYLLHQLNSTSNSYVIDKVDAILDAAIAEGKVKDCIVVIPDSAPDSWWMNGWDKMVTEEILPYVEQNYRTIQDREHRFTAGASMGGHGAYYIGLTNPDLFGGIISFFGAINMGANPLLIAMEKDATFLNSFTQYFVCGNRDLYKFGIPAIELDQYLRRLDVPHYFELGEGGHDGGFYLPRFADGFAYVTAAME